MRLPRLQSPAGLMLFAIGLAGCQHMAPLPADGFTQVDDRPYAVRLLAEAETVLPGQPTAVLIEVQNTSSESIHLPSSELVWLGRDFHTRLGYHSESEISTRHYGPTDPDLKPRKIRRYRKELVAPNESGHLRITSSFSSKIDVWIEVSAPDLPAPAFDRETRRVIDPSDLP